MTSATVPQAIAGATIRQSVHCRSCGYNLRGLTPAGRCPECAAEIWQSLLHTIDPAASRLPKLINPRRVGWSLLWIMSCLLLAVVLIMLFALAMWLENAGSGGRPTILQRLPLRELPLLAGVIGFAGMLGIWGLARPPGPDPTGAVRRDLRLMGLGLACWSLVLLMRGLMFRLGGGVVPGDAVWVAMSLISDIGAVVGLVGMRRVLLVIGLRSREYRNARGARQGVRSMVAAVCAHAAGRSLQLLHQFAGGDVPGLARISQVLVAISALMLVIGLAYLVVNAWWIRSSLRKPPPALEDLLEPSTPGPGASSPAREP